MSQEPNTTISYLYRDACNYKSFHSVVIPGLLSLDSLRPYLRDGFLFVPSCVELPDLHSTPLTVDDHIWHEIDLVHRTTSPPTERITAQKLLDLFKEAAENAWHETAVFRRKGML